MTGLLAAAWADYEETIVVPASASAVQVQETRKAFYAGAQALLGGMLDKLEPDGEETPAEALMDGIKGEQEAER